MSSFQLGLDVTKGCKKSYCRSLSGWLKVGNMFLETRLLSDFQTLMHKPRKSDSTSGLWGACWQHAAEPTEMHPAWSVRQEVDSLWPLLLQSGEGEQCPSSHAERSLWLARLLTLTGAHRGKSGAGPPIQSCWSLRFNHQSNGVYPITVPDFLFDFFSFIVCIVVCLSREGEGVLIR